MAVEEIDLLTRDWGIAHFIFLFVLAVVFFRVGIRLNRLGKNNAGPKPRIMDVWPKIAVNPDTNTEALVPPSHRKSYELKLYRVQN